MADKKIYTIQINGIKESIDGVSTLQDSLEKLGTSVQSSGGNFKAAAKNMDELAKVEQKIKQYNEEYQTALQSSKMVLSDNNKAIKDKLDLEKAELTVSENLQDTYAHKQQLLTALGKVIRNSTEDTTELQERYAALNQELKDFDATLGNHQRNVGDYGQATKNLKQELREYQAEMANMLQNGVDKADPAFVALAEKAGKLKDAMSDAGEEVSRFASDTKKIDDVINLAQSATAVFGLWQGAMSAFGMETEETEKAIQKLMGAMTVIQSLKELSEALQNGSMTAKLFNGALGLVTKGMQGASLGAKALRIALASIGIGLIIALVAELVTHWEDLVGWFNKTFPAVKKVGGAMNGLKAVIVGVGKAIINWLTNPLETFVKAVKKLFSGDFSGAVSEISEGFKRQFEGTARAFKEGFKEQVERGLEDMTRKAAAEEDKQLTHHKNMITKQKNADGTYRKEYIEANKKMFENRKKMYKKGSDEYNKVLEDEAKFFQSVEDAKTAAAAAASKKRVDAAKKNGEEQKKAEEAALQYSQKVNGSFYRSLTNYLIKQKEQEIEVYKAGVKLYEAGPIEKYLEEVEKLNEAETELYNLNRQLKLQNYFDDYASNIDSGVTSLNDFMVAINHITDKMKEFGGEVPVDMFDLFASQEKMFVNLTADQMKYLYKIVIDYMTDGLEKAKTVTAEESEVVKKQLESERKDIELTGLKFELTEDKKSQAAIDLQKKLKKQWDDYLEHVKQIYGEDSEEYLKAVKAKKDADSKGGTTKSGSSKKPKSISGNTNWEALWDPEGPVWENMADITDMMFENVFDPIANAFSTLLEFQIEEAEEALDKATAMHEKSVDAVEESNNRLADIKSQMTSANAQELEKLKEQQADEMVLLAQREAEEKRLAREKEKREAELEKKKKQQKKLDMTMQLVQSIVNTAVGVTRALEWGWPLGTIFAGIIGAMGAMETAIISKQLAKLADGGVLGGKEHKDGGVKIPSLGVEVERGEAVINKRSTAKYLPLLDAINAEGNGGKHTLLKTRGNLVRKYANGGVLNYQKIDDNFNTLNGNKAVQQAIESIDLHPVVEVVQIAKGLNDLSTVREIAGGGKLLK